MAKKERPTMDATIEKLLATKGSFSSTSVADELGVSRQAAHRALKKRVDSGQLIHVGLGRGAHFRAPDVGARYRRAGLAEDEVWSELSPRIAGWPKASDAARRAMRYAFTEMLNNAIDHSDSEYIDVVLGPTIKPLWFAVRDNGPGVFEHIRQAYFLQNPYAVIEQLQKGKVTTDPSRHTGEGIFFTSKIADRFQLEANKVRWVIDNVRHDSAIADSERDRGTEVRFELSGTSKRSLEALFAEYSGEDYSFAKTRVNVKLFERDTEFVSRSEAKRLLSSVERFEEVILDFSNVKAVGQAFADEVFRVWAGEHPRTRLFPTNMADSVSHIVYRAINARREAQEKGST